jgi:hypothetical protein
MNLPFSHPAIIELLYQSLFLRQRKKATKVTDMDLLLKNLGKAGVLLAVTAMLCALQSWLLKHDGNRKASFTWDAIGGMLKLKFRPPTRKVANLPPTIKLTAGRSS